MCTVVLNDINKGYFPRYNFQFYQYNTVETVSILKCRHNDNVFIITYTFVKNGYSYKVFMSFKDLDVCMKVSMCQKLKSC